MKKHYSLFLSFLLLNIIFVHAQQPYPTGLIINENSIRAYNKLTPLNQFKGSSFAQEALAQEKSLKLYCPTPDSQPRGISSCVSFALVYYAYSIQNALLNSWTNQAQIDNNAFSPSFLHNQIANPNLCENGIALEDAIHFLKSKGAVSNTQFHAATCSVKPSTNLNEEASYYKIKDCIRLFPMDEGNNSLKIYKIKQALHNNRPVVVGFKVTNSFWDAKTEFWYPARNEIEIDKHAICVVGYDDRRGAFEVVNSWGKKWGKGGFIWIKYEHFVRNVMQAVTLYTYPTIPYYNSSATTKLAGSFELKKYAESTFFSQQVEKNGNYYEVKSNIYKNDKLKLIATSKTNDNYLYVFSIDPDNKVYSHFPKFSESETEIESALVPNEKATIIIPDTGKMLVKDKLGTDYLCILFCDRELEDYSEMLDFVARKVDNGTEPYQALHLFFTNRLISSENIHYKSDIMSFISSTREEGIVPIILKVTATY